MSGDSLLGKQLDEYLIERPLGRGGMASVYLARDVKLQRYVALKVIASDFRSNQEYKDRFEREAQSVARLHHPSIVQIYRFGELYGVYYMAMQYIEGADLGNLLYDYKRAGELMPIADVVRVIDDIGLALDYAHSRGVIHRDVKASNIIVNKEGQALLTDFGLVLLSDVGTQGEVFGSPEYIAPEQAISSKNVVPQSDLYALGVTLFEMLTGEVPFVGKDSMEVAMRHLTDAPPSPSDFNPAIPPVVNAVVLKMLEKEPAQRYQTGNEFSKAFQKAVKEWTQGYSASESAAKRPSLISIPQKVRDYVQSESLPTLPPTPPISMTPAAPIYPPPMPIVDATQLHRPQQQPSSYPWRRVIVIAGVVFVVGLIAILALLGVLLNRNSERSVSSVTLTTVIQAAALETTVAPTAAPSATPSLTSSPTIIPAQIGAPVLPTQPVFPTAIPTLPIEISWTATPIPPTVVIPTSTPIPITFTLLIQSRKDDSVFVMNQSPYSFPLPLLRLHDAEGAIAGQEWNITALGSGACVAAWKENGNAEAPDISCEVVGERVTREGRNRFWREDFHVYYNDVRVGTCDSETCVITFSP